jgi:hypothetical protein
MDRGLVSGDSLSIPSPAAALICLQPLRVGGRFPPKEVVMSKRVSLAVVPVALLGAGLFACGGSGPAPAPLEESKDAITASQVAGEWDLTFTTTNATYQFAGCTIATGCEISGQMSVQDILDAICQRTNGKICFPSSFTEHASIAAVSSQGLVLTAPNGSQVAGWANPWGNQAYFANGSSVLGGSGADGGGLGNLNVLVMQLQPGGQSSSGALYLAFAAGLVIEGYAGGGLIVIQLPMTGARSQ